MANDCPKCKARMEVGFIEESVTAFPFLPGPSRWIEGAPEPTSWGLKRKGKRKFDVSTDRCTACGYLESYAK
jgi:hypothetical protein